MANPRRSKYGIVVWYVPKQHTNSAVIVENYVYSIVNSFDKVLDEIRRLLKEHENEIGTVMEIKVFNLRFYLDDFCEEIDPELEPMCNKVIA